MRERSGLGAMALAIAGLAGCGSDRMVQGGGATETGNGIHVAVVAFDGRPAAYAQVRVVRTDTWIQDLARTGVPISMDLTADRDGRLDLDSLPEGEWAAQVDWGSQAGRMVLGRDSAIRRLGLQPVSRVREVVSGAEGVAVHIVGTTWSARADSLGRVVMYLPPGSHPLVGTTEGGLAQIGVASVRIWNPVDSQMRLDPRRVLLDDFTSGTSRTNISRYTGLGGWYSTSSEGVRIFSDLDSSNVSYVGKLSMRYVLPDSSGFAAVGISFHDDQGYHDADLSGMDSLCFDLQGDGNLELYWERFDAQFRSQAWAKAVHSPIPAAWEHLCVTPTSFGTQWDSVESAANNLTFLSRKGSRLDLRNIVMWGVPLRNLSR